MICKNYGRMLLAAIMLLTGCLSGASAQDSQGKVRELLLKMQRAYLQSNYLDFHITYYYANRDIPDKPLDSLLGRVQTDKGRCRLLIDNTEMLVTDKYTIQVLRQEKTIYLSKAKHSSTMDPVGILDSVLAHMDGIHADVKHKDGMATLDIGFPPGRQYTKIGMVIDEKTGFLLKATYELQAASLVGQEMIERPGHRGLYKPDGQVDVIFGGYRTGSFGETVFDENRFVRKVADTFEPAERFKDYHVFLASTNL